MRPTIGIGHLKLTVPSTANTLAGSSQNTAVPNIFTQWVKTPLGSPSMQRQMTLPTFARLALSSPKLETPLENTRALQQTPPPGFAENTSTLRRSQPYHPLLMEEQSLPPMVRSTIVISRMVQDVWGMTTINIKTCQLNVMGLEPTPLSSTITITEVLAETPVLEDTLESED